MQEEKKDILEGVVKVDKILRIKDCQKGEEIVSEYDKLAIEFREACVMCVTHQDFMNDMFSTALSKDNEVVNKYLQGEKIEDNDANQAILQFEKFSIQYVVATRNRREILSKFNSVKKNRDSFGKKMFKRYGLDSKKTYKLDWKTQSIYEVIEDKKETTVNPN